MKLSLWQTLTGLFLALLLFPACYQEIELKPSDTPPRLVVYSLFSPDSIFKVRVGRTVAINEFRNPDTLLWLDDAVCSLFVNDHFLEVLTDTGLGYYVSTSNYHPQPDSVYRLVVDHHVYGRAETQSSIPPGQMQILSVYKQDSALMEGTDMNPRPISYAKITINNDLQVAHYLELFLTQYEYHLGDSTIYTTPGVDIVKEPLGTLSSGLTLSSTNSLIFSSSLLSSGQNSLELYYYPLIYEIVMDTTFAYANLQVNLRILSPEFYNYLLSLERLDRSDYFDNPTFILSLPPTNLYSNVQGGYGLFAGFQQIRDSLSYPMSLDSGIYNYYRQIQSQIQ